MKNDQLEMKLSNANCRSVRRHRRAYRARWWFSQMRAVVNSAPDQKPAEERELLELRKVA
jgi:hypothetical protein